jgi:hypothetical protein
METVSIVETAVDLNNFKRLSERESFYCIWHSRVLSYVISIGVLMSVELRWPENWRVLKCFFSSECPGLLWAPLYCPRVNMFLPPHPLDYGSALCCILPRLFDKSATFFSLRLAYLHRTQARQGLRSPVTNVVRILRMYGASPWVDSVFVACCLVKYKDCIFFCVTPRGGFVRCTNSVISFWQTALSLPKRKSVRVNSQ